MAKLAADFWGETLGLGHLLIFKIPNIEFY